jgi:hypothetical protein
MAITMDSNENSNIRIPVTLAQKFWLGLVTLFTAAFLIATLIDSHFLLGILAMIYPLSWVGNWILKSPGKIEFASDRSYFVKSRKILPWKFDDDNWEQNIFPRNFHLHLMNTGYRWLDNRLEIITPTRTIFLGSGEKMLPIRDWLVRHDMQPK